MSTKKLTHLDEKGRAHMVDVSDKPSSVREATATGAVRMQPETLQMICEQKMPKGDVFATARLAGIMAAKKTPELIPLCHPLMLSSVQVELTPSPDKSRVEISATVKTTGPTGVEMEALTAVSAAALTIYDMCKAVDKEMVISEIFLMEKKGGRSGHYRKA